MAENNYKNVYVKNPNIPLMNQASAVAEDMCTNTLAERIQISASPSVPLNLATEQQSQLVASRLVLSQPSSSVYETNQLRASVSPRVVMVTGLDEAVTMLLNSHGIERGVDSGGGGGDVGAGGARYSEGLMMFTEADNAQHTSADYLDFEQGDSLQGADGVVQYSSNNNQEEDEAAEMNSDVKASSSSDARTLMLEHTKSTLEGFISSTHDAEVHTLNSSDSQQQVVRVIDLIQASGPNIFRLITNTDGTVSFVSVPSSQQEQDEEEEADGGVQFVQVQAVDVHTPTPRTLSLPFPRTIKGKKLPPGCPAWALALNNCEKIGDSYRGWVETDTELDTVLTYFRQVTHTYWGTRQSPSQSKPSTRLMWKSQYVPFDGIPFINAGSRAIVMECQYGPRRQSNSKKLSVEMEPKKVFKQSCPARVYIKKVRKFPEFAIDCELDKRQLKAAMDHAFHNLKESSFDKIGEDRFYIQLPTEAAHEFHSESLGTLAAECPHRLHPRVSEKLREIISGGEMRLYVIRNMLRHFVDKELFADSDKPPARHNLTYFPTVNDLQNNIHQAIHDIEAGILPFTAPAVNMDVSSSSTMPSAQEEVTESGASSSDVLGPYAQKVTVTLCAKPGEGGQHVISKVETLMSDGRILTSSSLPPELAHIISSVPHSPGQGEDVDQKGLAETVSLSDTDAPSEQPEELSMETFETQLHSNKFSSSDPQTSIKREVELDECADVNSHFTLEGSCDDIVEQFCATEPWRKELEMGAKRLLNDVDLQANTSRFKRKRLN